MVIIYGELEGSSLEGLAEGVKLGFGLDEHYQEHYAVTFCTARQTLSPSGILPI